jgi:hypothetical protein
MPKSDDQAVTLDNLLLHLDLLWARYKILHQMEDYHALRVDCTALQDRFTKWANGQAPEARPTTVANLGYGKQHPNVSVGCWPGRIDTYSDLYIASVWNIARVARLLLIVLIAKLSDDLNDTSTHLDPMRDADTIIGDIIASVPYHLTENLYEFLEGPQTEIEEPGRTLGGLLLMHPLYVVTRVPFISEPIKAYSLRCLLWIASSMGIGHAEWLAKVLSN